MKNNYIIWFLIIAFLLTFYAKEAPAQITKTDSLLTILKSTIEDTTKVNILNLLAYENRNNQPDTAIYFANMALSLAEKLNYKSGMADAFLYKGSALKTKGEFETALHCNKEALSRYNLLLQAFNGTTDIFDKTKTLKQIAAAYNNTGIICQERGDYPEAIKNHGFALKIREGLSDKKGISSSYNNLGLVFMNQGNYPEALNNYYAALRINEETGNKILQSNNLNNIGIIYFQQNNYQDALKNYYDALKISEETNDTRGIASTKVNIGKIYIKQTNYPEAMKMFSEGLRLFQERGEERGIANCFYSMGIINFSQNNLREALKNYFSALEIGEKIGDKQSSAMYCNGIGTSYTQLGKIHEASDFLNKSLTIAQEIGSLQHIALSYANLSALDSMLGNYKQAFGHYKMYVVYRDSLLNEENTKKLVQTQMQYEFDKKEAATRFAQEKKDAVALAEIGKQKVIRNAIAGGTGVLMFSSVFSFLFYKRRRDAIEKQKEAEFGLQVSDVEMKALRSQMNPHFIFNSMNSIHRFIQQQNVKEASEYIIKFSRLMRLVLENSEHQEVELTKDLEALNLYMQLESLRMDKHFDFEIKIDDSIDRENTMVPPLLLQPFIENSIWHGLMLKETTGKITINISKENEMIKCIVEDNGVGRERAQQAKGNKEKKSLGMKITKSRIDIINKIKKSNAFIHLTDLYDHLKNPSGTRVEIQFPVAYQY